MKFSVDYSNLDKLLDKKTFRLADVQHRIEKVAFDIVRFRDGDPNGTSPDGTSPEQLWQVQSADDGDYIVSLYREDDVKKEAGVKAWSCTLNKSGSEMYFFYRGDRVAKLSADQLGLPRTELATAVQYLPTRLAANKNLSSALLKQASVEVRVELVKKYPELA